MLKVLITGGAGFIGVNTAAYYLKKGARVTIFDNLSRTGTRVNLEWLKKTYQRVNTLIQDIRDAEAVISAVKNQDLIFHFAGQVAVTTSVTNPREDFEINALGTLNVLEALRKHNPQAILLYSSTNKVYGDLSTQKVKESTTRYELVNLPHGVSEGESLDFHSPYGCCYSRDTDILTRDGWKRFYELQAHDEVLTYSLERKTAEYQVPTANFAFPYEGKMYVQTNRRLKTCVTPNHKMLVSWDCNHNELERPKLVEAQSIYGKPMAYLAGADMVEGIEQKFFILPGIKGEKYKHDFSARQIHMDDWLKFLGWYLAEGHCHWSQKTQNCSVTLTTYYRIEEAIEVMQSVGLVPVIDKHHIVATSKQVYEYVKRFGKSYTKYIPQEIKSLCKKQLSILLHALLDGDGNYQSKNSWRYTTVSKKLADDVQEIAIKSGMAASIASEGKLYRVYLNTTRTIQCNLDKNRCSWKLYKGKVYCVEVPNSTVLVRQNGHAYFSGNSKGSADQYVRDYARIYGLNTIVFRQSCIYGPHQFGVEDQGWVAWFLAAAILNKPIIIYGNGKQVRDLLYIDDLINAYELAIKNIKTTSGQIYNLGGGAGNTISIWKEFGPLVEKLVGHQIKVKYQPTRPGDQPIFISDTRKAQKDFGWKPITKIDSGVSRLYNWLIFNYDSTRQALS